MSKGLSIDQTALIAALLLHLLLLLTVQTGRRPLLPEVAATRIAIRLRPVAAPPSPVTLPAAVVARPVVEKENQNHLSPRPLPAKVVPAPATTPPVTVTAPTPALPVAAVAPSIAPAPAAVAIENNATREPASSGEGSPVVAAPPAASPPAPSQLGSYLASVRTQVEAHKDYPAFARQLRLQGTVTVRVEIGSDGRLRAATILASSGHSHLDKAALAAVRNAGRFPAPENFSRSDVVVDIPITFKLI